MPQDARHLHMLQATVNDLSPGIIASDGNGGFTVSGTQTFAAQGTYNPIVTITDTSNDVTGVMDAAVAIASISASPAPIHAVESLPFAGTVATFTD